MRLGSKYFMRVLAALFSVALMSGTVHAASSDVGQIDPIYQQGMQAGSGGSYGYFIKQAGGPVLLERNSSLVYDPASALKTLVLAYAMNQVAKGADSLSSPVTVYRYPNSRNALGDPANKDLCPNLADEVAANASSLDLESVLGGMMQASNNRYTRALELRYGRANLVTLATSLGMSSTSWGQIFGCGWDGGQKNSWNLIDAGKLYEAIVSGAAAPAPVRNQLLSMMQSSDVNYTAVVRSEEASLGIPGADFDFLQDAEVYDKPGSYDICADSCVSSTVIIRDTAGILILPVQTVKGVVPTFYVWGSFIANELASCPSIGGCPAGATAFDAVKGALPEVFRPAIRSALMTWLSVTALSVRPVVYINGRLRAAAVLSRRYGSQRLNAQRVSFTLGGRTLCSAVTNSAGLATCLARPPRVKARTYSARFIGGSGLFPSSGTARVPPAPKPKK